MFNYIFLKILLFFETAWKNLEPRRPQMANDKCFACCMTNVADKLIICNIYLRHPVEGFVMPYSCWSCSMCLVYRDILWNFHIDMKGMLHRHSRTSGEHSCLFRSVELCSNNRRVSCVERWCTPDEKQLQVEMSCVLLMGELTDCCRNEQTFFSSSTWLEDVKDHHLLVILQCLVSAAGHSNTQ